MKENTTIVHQNHNIKFPSCKICSHLQSHQIRIHPTLMDIVEHHKRPMKKPRQPNQTKTIDKNDEIMFKTSSVDGRRGHINCLDILQMS